MCCLQACDGEALTAAAIPVAALREAVAIAAEPPHAADEPPEWLLAAQRESFAWALAALRRHGTACVADPVGSGKTYVALAVAAAWSRSRPAACLVPAILAEQWAAVARRVGVPVELQTHERMSRGTLFRGDASLVIIDESHRFRIPTTRRYRTLAPWLVGRNALLLTGTPVVNRIEDLLHQLRLAGADDTLAPFGVPSLAELLGAGAGHRALSRLVIVGGGVRTGAPSATRPRRVARDIRLDDPVVARLAGALDALRLSAASDVAALVRVGLLRALASTPAAFSESLRRYRALLRHAADAAVAGRPVTRRELRAAVGADDAQLVLWALLDASPSGVVELDPHDLPTLDLLIRAASHQRPDPKADRLAALLADGRRSIVFVTHRASVAYLRGALRGMRVAWCTGNGAGIGYSRAGRHSVLAAFDPAAHGRVASVDVLISTDVAAEGLDLQRAERVVHYDLPWTPMRLRQREGRALRLGSAHEQVEVARFRPDDAIERRLGMTGTLRRKAALPARLGLEQREGTSQVTRQLHVARTGDIIERLVGGGRDAPLTVRAGPAGSASNELIVTGIARSAGEGDPDRVVLWRRPDGALVRDPAAILARLGTLTDAPVLIASDAAAPLIADATSLLRAAGSDCIGGGLPGSPHAAPADLIGRLTALADAAARARDETRLALVDRALRFLRRGHTAGEAMVVTTLARCGSSELLHRIAHLPPERPTREAWRPTMIIAVGPAP